MVLVTQNWDVMKILISIILWTWQVNVDSREAELSWLGTWLVYFLVATVEIIISAANTTFNQVRILSANRNTGVL